MARFDLVDSTKGVSEISSSGSSRKQRLGQLDGLRALAILGVMLHHFGVHAGPWFDWGPVAPTAFFILSGFLITRSLIKMRGSGRLGWEGLAAFHVKRIARLLPALYLMLLVGWFSGLPEYREGVGWHFSFLSNTWMALTGEWAGSASQLWSLSIQEQFYLLWPLVFFLRLSWLPAGMVGVAAVALGFRIWCLGAGTSDMFRWFMLPASLDSFAAGGLLALFLRRNPGWAPGRAALWSGGALIACFWVADRLLRHLEGTGSLLIAFVEMFEIGVFCALIAILATCPTHPLSRFLASRPLAAVGKISYGLFIWHMLVSTALGPYLDAIGLTAREALLPRTALLLGASLVVAWLSWIAIERPSIAWAGRTSEAVPAFASRLRALRTRVALLLASARSERESA